MVVVSGRCCKHESGEIVASERHHGSMYLVYQVEIVQSIVEAFVVEASGVVACACNNVQTDGHVSHADMVSELAHVVLFKLNKQGGHTQRP